jgi:hypothetical protein
VAVQMILNLKPKPSRELPGAVGVFAVGTGIGAISALVAIGGGSLTVPFLTWCNVRVQHAIGTSAAVGFPIALGGSLGYIFNGWEHTPPAARESRLHLPAGLLWLVPSSMLIAPFGARLAHRLPVATLKRLFAGVLIAAGGQRCCGVSSGEPPLIPRERRSATAKIRLALFEERRQAFAVVFGIEKGERGAQFLLAERNIVLQAAHPLLVPGGDQWRAGADAPGTGIGFGNHFGIGDDTRSPGPWPGPRRRRECGLRAGFRTPSPPRPDAADLPFRRDTSRSRAC